MFPTALKKFFLYGIAIAGLEEFITQGVLKDSYFLWVFTLLPFGVFLCVARCIGIALYEFMAPRHAAVLYYLAAGTIGLAVEWFLIGLSPWSDSTSPAALIVVFHAGMFSFWGTVAFAPHVLLDPRPQIAGLKRRLATTFAALLAAAYVLTFAAKISAAGQDVQFLACIGPIVIAFLTMNVFYVQYFRGLVDRAQDGQRL